MTSIFIYTFILSLLSGIITILLSSKYNFFIDRSDTDKPQNFHQVSTPRAGGIGILVGLMMLLVSTFGLKLLFPIFFSFASGIFEDFHGSLSPKRRLFLQFIAALSAVWLTGSVVVYLGLGITMPYWIGTVFSL